MHKLCDHGSMLSAGASHDPGVSFPGALVAGKLCLVQERRRKAARKEDEALFEIGS